MLYLALGLVILAGILTGIALYRKPNALFILAYEKIGKAPQNSRLKNEWITVKQLKKTLLWLRAHGFTPINAGRLTASATRPPKPVLLVFMGGYKSFLTDIFPLLQDSQTPATLFLPTNTTGTYNKWQNPHQEPWQNLLTEKELKTLAKSGLISFGALALNGEDLSALPTDQAAYLAQESVFRLHTQLGLKAEGFAFYPAEKKIKNITDIAPKNLTVFIDNPTPNALTEKAVLNVFFPQKHPWKTFWNLFIRR
ncbi:polysaccharide deacetylase family protein [Candidatus Avelusimicrobium stercoris]|uniref:polysaccharide deacetylase family protein n=1 Tax=Candidatus Avelusimicrobium stercoris TaxID=1947924 RepID=UPI003D0E4A64